ncbi:MAG: helix-turn-helix transcriptional regulator [Thermoleophilia bacterium]
MTRTTMSDLTTHGQLVADELNGDVEFRQAWERLALARTVAAEVIRYRADHDLSQRDLARRLDMRQPQVARLENAEHNPSHDTLVLLASRLGIEFNISIVPANKTSTLLTKKAREDATACVRADDAVVRFNAR